MLILNYHRVGRPSPQARYRGMYVTPNLLAWHVFLLKARGREFVTLTEGVRRGCGPNLVALTFDDGYLDNLELGLPVLKAAGVPATVYVVSDDVGKKNVVWPESGDRLASNLMTWDDLRRLQAEGWEVGSHAADHVHLARKTEEDQRTLIARSWSSLKENLDREPTSFAYPYGSYNEKTLEVLTNLGCVAAVTIKSDGVNSSDTQVLELFRHPAKGYAVRHIFSALRLLWQG